MLSLTYVSSASELLDNDQLVQLMAAIRPKNQALGLTGMLLYSGGNIIQTLEGPDDMVDRTFAAIAEDSRHKGVLLLLREPISERAFPDWSMGFRRLSQDEVQQTPGFTTFLEQPAPVDPAPGQAVSSTYRLLELFKQNMR